MPKHPPNADSYKDPEIDPVECWIDFTLSHIVEKIENLQEIRSKYETINVKKNFFGITEKAKNEMISETQAEIDVLQRCKVYFETAKKSIM